MVEQVSHFLSVALDKWVPHFFQVELSQALSISSFSLISELDKKVEGCQKNRLHRIFHFLVLY